MGKGDVPAHPSKRELGVYRRKMMGFTQLPSLLSFFALSEVTGAVEASRGAGKYIVDRQKKNLSEPWLLGYTAEDHLSRERQLVAVTDRVFIFAGRTSRSYCASVIRSVTAGIREIWGQKQINHKRLV